MGAVGIGKVACHEDLMRFDAQNQVAYDGDVLVGKIAFFDCACFVERKAEEMHVFRFHAHEFACRAGFCLPYHGLDGADILAVHVAGLLIGHIVVDLLALLLEIVVVESEYRCDVVVEHDVAHHVLVAHCDVARCLVGYMHVVALVHKALECAAH